MNSWSSNCNTAQMANNLVKWWRTKFLNGYKPFTVECNEGRVSDTEELLGRRSVDYQTSCTTPPLQSQATRNPSTPLISESQTPQQPPVQHHLNLQEFSCDVSVEGGPDKSTQERQEFSFTLYDFDGHGKITKDDIAGLVTTIYEVLGSSVKVPHYGSKTIKVKLTVSPDQRKHVSATVIDHKDNKSEDKQSEQNVKMKQDLNVTIKQGTNNANKKHCKNQGKGQENRKHYCCRKLDEEHEVTADISEDYSDICSRVSADATSDDEEGECSDDQTRCKRIQQKRYQKHSSSRYTTPNRCTKESNTVNQKDSFLRSKKVKKRSTSLQRQELLEIIQSNMDKNNSSFQTTRKPCTDHINTDNNQLQQNEVKQHRHRHKGMRVPTMPLHYLANMVDPTHFYVDLASLQNTTQFTQNNCHYDKLIDAVMCMSNKKVPENRTEPCKKHNRSKSYDLSNTPFRYHLLEHPIINIDNMNKSARKPTRKLTDFEPTAAVKKNIRKFPQVVLGHTSSPHHLRHRNRQEDQARAMAQVVRWLEQEFSSNLNTNDSKEKVQSNCWAGDQEKYSCSMPASPNSGTERHEHHHVHEHIHHHYHHYQEASVVV